MTNGQGAPTAWRPWTGGPVTAWAGQTGTVWGTASQHSERLAIQNLRTVYFWNFPFNLFAPQLTVGNESVEAEPRGRGGKQATRRPWRRLGGPALSSDRLPEGRLRRGRRQDRLSTARPPGAGTRGVPRRPSRVEGFAGASSEPEGAAPQQGARLSARGHC